MRVAIRDGKNIAAGLPSIIAAQPQVVVVACGHNDAMPNVAYTQTEAAALRDLETLRAALPEAKIVVVGPIWLNGHPDQKGALRAPRNPHGSAPHPGYALDRPVRAALVHGLMDQAHGG